MKNIILIIFIATSFKVFCQGSAVYKKVKVTDSVYVPTGRVSAYEFYKNGIPFSTGGDVYLGNRQTLTKRNIFSDTLKATQIVLFDSLKVSNKVTATSFAGAGALITGITADNITSGTLTDAVLSSNIPRLDADEEFTGINIFSSADNIYYGSGSNLRGLNATYVNNGTLDTARLMSVMPKDTNLFARVVSGISETFNSVVTFASAVIYSGSVTFNSTVTMTSDLIVSWVKNQSSASAYQYEKVKIIPFKASATLGAAVTSAHGITNWHTIKSWSCVVHEDSLNLILAPGAYFGTDVLFYARIDSLNCYFAAGSNAYAVKSDSIFFRIVYTDFTR